MDKLRSIFGLKNDASLDVRELSTKQEGRIINKLKSLQVAQSKDDDHGGMVVWVVVYLNLV